MKKKSGIFSLKLFISSLIDYEMLKENGKRLVYMGFTAGLAATINTLAVMGIVLLKKGFGTPFLNIKYSYK